TNGCRATRRSSWSDQVHLLATDAINFECDPNKALIGSERSMFVTDVRDKRVQFHDNVPARRQPVKSRSQTRQLRSVPSSLPGLSRQSMRLFQRFSAWVRGSCPRKTSEVPNVSIQVTFCAHLDHNRGTLAS